MNTNRREIAEHLVASVDSSATEWDVATIEEGLSTHALRNGVEPRVHVPLVVVLRHREIETVGGLVGSTVWGWLQVKRLWIARDFRLQGLGRNLMLLAEGEAEKRGCHHSMVDTFDFQSLQFYEKLGYNVFGQLDDFPIGHKRYFLSKRLAAQPGAPDGESMDSQAGKLSGRKK